MSCYFSTPGDKIILLANRSGSMIPSHLYRKLQEKVTHGVFDIGSKFVFSSSESSIKLVLCAAEDIDAFEDIYIIDHMLTFKSELELESMLRATTGLRDRLFSLLGLKRSEDYQSTTSSDAANEVTVIKKAMWPLIGSYQLRQEHRHCLDAHSNRSQYDLDSLHNSEETIYYMLDEVGSRLAGHLPLCDGCFDFRVSDPALDSAIIWLSEPFNYAVTVVWPVRSISEGEIATCTGNGIPEGLARVRALQSVFLANEEGSFGDAAPCMEALGDRLRSLGYGAANVSKALDVSVLGSLLPVWEFSNPNHRSLFLGALEKAKSCSPTAARERTQKPLKYDDEQLLSSDRRINHHDAIDPKQYPVALQTVIRCFLLGVPVSGTSLKDALGTNLVAALVACNLLYPLREKIAIAQIVWPFMSDPKGGDREDESDELCDKPDASLSNSQQVPVVSIDESLFYSMVQLTPVAYPVGNVRIGAMTHLPADIVVAADFAQISSLLGFEPVMYIGPDSLALVHSAPTQLLALQRKAAVSPDIKILDLCSGSGVQSLMALRAQDYETSATSEGGRSHAWLVDRNPRAVRFASANSHLNGLGHRVTIKEGDAGDLDSIEFEEDEEGIGAIDLLLLNPPYIPTFVANNIVVDSDDGDTEGCEGCGVAEAGQLLAYGDGGVCGEAVTAAALSSRNLEARLSDSTLFCVVANLMNPRRYPEKLNRWWLADSVESQYTARAIVTHGQLWSPLEYASMILANDSGVVSEASSSASVDGSATAPSAAGSRIASYCDTLISSGVETVANGLVFVCASREACSRPTGDVVLQSESQVWQAVAMSNNPGDSKWNTLNAGGNPKGKTIMAVRKAISS